MIKAGLKRFILDYSTFVKNLDTNKIVIIIVYIDDFLFFEPDFTEINIVKSFLVDQYRMKNLGSYKLEQNLETKIILLFQRVYIQKTLEYTNMIDSKLVYSPLILRIDFSKNINKPLNEDFIRFYQSYINTHI